MGLEPDFPGKVAFHDKTTTIGERRILFACNVLRLAQRDQLRQSRKISGRLRDKVLFTLALNFPENTAADRPPSSSPRRQKVQLTFCPLRFLASFGFGSAAHRIRARSPGLIAPRGNDPNIDNPRIVAGSSPGWMIWPSAATCQEPDFRAWNLRQLPVHETRCSEKPRSRATCSSSDLPITEGVAVAAIKLVDFQIASTVGQFIRLNADNGMAAAELTCVRASSEFGPAQKKLGIKDVIGEHQSRFE